MKKTNGSEEEWQKGEYGGIEGKYGPSILYLYVNVFMRNPVLCIMNIYQYKHYLQTYLLSQVGHILLSPHFI